MTNNNNYDIVIVGAGVVGCAMARQFTLEGAKVLIIEKATDILEGASKGNSAILHTGFDAKLGTVEHHCLVQGYEKYLQIHHQLNLPIFKTGALVTAWNDEQQTKLDTILAQAHANGVHDATLFSAQEVTKQEPNLASNIKGAVYVPREFVIDPWTTPYTYMLHALKNGAQLRCNTELLQGEFDGSCWQLQSNHGTIKCSSVINCAGLYADKVDKILTGQSNFEIKPHKGQFLIYDKSANTLINSIILPVPNKDTKGVVVCRTAFGNLLVGPTNEAQTSREDASVKQTSLKNLAIQGIRIIPKLKEHNITATYAGIRTATQFKDYCITANEQKNYISVGGIRSTGLTAALGIAEYVFELYQKFNITHAPSASYACPKVTAIAQNQTRDWQLPNNEGIVCHCELVTKREIKLALNDEIPIASLAALKRRTRVTMGRCQGFYCSAQLSELTKGHFVKDLAKSIINDD